MTLNLQFIKKRRLDLKLSMMNVSEELGFKNASTYLKYETGEYELKAEMLPTLANILECDIENFFTQDVAKIEIW